MKSLVYLKIGILLSFIFIILEISLRLPYFESVRFGLADKELHCLSKDLLPWIRLCPNRRLTLFHPAKKYSYSIRTDENGERISYEPGTTPLTAQKEIWILGDSVAMGYLVEDRESISWKLGERIGSSVRVRNLGVDAVGTLGIRERLRELLMRSDPPHTAYWIYHISDVADSFREEALFESRVRRFLTRVSFYLSRYSAVFNGWKALREKYLPSLADNRISLQEETATESLKKDHPHRLALKRLFSFCKDKKIPLVIVFLPEPNSANKPVFQSPILNDVQSLALENRISVLDLRPRLESIWKEKQEPFFLARDGHPNPYTYGLVADFLSEDSTRR
ncbi:hypothetical protein LEP1GSC047_3312 [Leptospira inadai serovar Lyme str. 10]|uniref:AlgX/AlgJ SGNH hydrolase-like domain-containing protein n=2 Tax=Leptospira inadai serovar Lyme TaxID=293084 RepID=V6HHU1_9LEPT|nr:hypothetical protein [Leptospira inadai]EQA36085.1 hypothetical protein LEP1GSC047_3312 [Leptospira inadai serovar Lyme str. 10]PNV74906.1 hypothetical protein BES34_011595 [Leptospira inadai serovar Lyme]